MAVDTDMILTVGRFIPDAGAPEGRTVRMEDYLAVLSRELETLYIRMNDLLRDLDGRTAALESAAQSAARSGALLTHSIQVRASLLILQVALTAS